MTGKPTPTPWRCKPFISHDPDISTPSGWANIWGADEQTALASVGGGVGAIGNFEANAALIVRAVNAHEDLVKALADCTERLRRCLVSSGSDPEYADIAVQKYHAALALARGDS